MKTQCIALAVLMVGISACSSESDDPAKTALKLDYIFQQQLLDEDSNAIEGVKLCVDGRSEIPCVQTDVTGVAALQLPKNTLLTVEYSKADFITKYRPLATGEDPPPGVGAWVFQRRTWYEAELANALAGSAADLDGLGLVGLQVGNLSNEPKGLQYRIEPKGAASEAAYFCTNSNKVQWCTDVSANQTGLAGFANVTPGKVRAFVTHSNLTCTPQLLPCSDGTASCTEVDVRAGALTHHFFDCQ